MNRNPADRRRRQAEPAPTHAPKPPTRARHGAGIPALLVRPNLLPSSAALVGSGLILGSAVLLGSAILLGSALLAAGCASTPIGSVRNERTAPPPRVRLDGPVAILPFEAENLLSNLGGQLADLVIIELLERAPDLKIIPASVVRNYLISSGASVKGIPDTRSIHELQQGLRCRYLLTGNLYTSIEDIQYTASFTRRIATGSLTARLVDCDSLNVIWARYIDSNYSTTLSYTTGGQQPTRFETDGQLLQGLIRNLAREVARSLVP